MRDKIKIIGNDSYPFDKKINEDTDLIKLINKHFVNKRGYVIKLPKKNTPVGVCMSGGMDSTAIIAILLEAFGYQVFPFFINRGQSNLKYEKESIDYYSNIFKKRYPSLFKECFEIKIDIPSKSYKKLLTEELKSNHLGYPARNTQIFLSGAEYLYSLQSKGIKINTIFGAAVASDSFFHSSLTWSRVTNLSMCQFLNDYNWQLIPLTIEQELGNSFDKDILIRYCDSIGISLDKTRTCTEKTKLQCGKCICCYDRIRCYKKANIIDRTRYNNE